MAPRSSGALPEHVLYHPHLSPGHLTLSEHESVHALKSLRLHRDDPVVLTDGRGTWGIGRIVEVAKKRVGVEVERLEERESWPAREIWLAMGVLKSNRLDVAVEKASELGAARFFPLVLHRSVARPAEGGAKENRWHRIALESLKQSRRSHLMEVEPPGALDAFLAGLPGARTLWVADPGGKPPEEAALGSEGPLVLLVGPEGGLDSRERESLLEAGGSIICLGHNRLRAETAAITLLVVALGRIGALAGGYVTS